MLRRRATRHPGSTRPWVSTTLGWTCARTGFLLTARLVLPGRTHTSIRRARRCAARSPLTSTSYRATRLVALTLALAGCSDLTGPGTAPAATVTRISPSTAARGSGGFALTVTGTGFVNGSLVRWNGVPRPTVLVSATQLRTIILPGDVATSGTIPVAVLNPGADPGAAKGVTFTIPRRRRR